MKLSEYKKHGVIIAKIGDRKKKTLLQACIDKKLTIINIKKPQEEIKKIEGKIRIENKTLKLIRVKSIEKSRYALDKKTGLKYATNEQIIKDIGITKNEHAKKIWIQMLSRYEKMFTKNYRKLEGYKLRMSRRARASFTS